MAKDRRPKKAAGKKAVSKGRVAKKTTLPKEKAKKVSKSEINSRRLAADLNYFAENEPFSDTKIVRSSKNKKGVQVGKLIPQYDRPGGRPVRYKSADGTIDISVIEFNRIRTNPRAAIHYTPVHDKNGKIVRYRNSYTGELVTPYYRHQKYGKAIREGLREGATDAEVLRARAFDASTEVRRHQHKQRRYNIIDSYELTLGPDNDIAPYEQTETVKRFQEAYPKKWRSMIANDPTFNSLVMELEAFSSQQHSITEEYWGTTLGIMGVYPDHDTIRESAEGVQKLLGEQPAYKQVLVDLGRRLPSDDFPVGDSPTGHIKLDVKPFYEAMFGPTYKEEEE